MGGATFAEDRHARNSSPCCTAITPTPSTPEMRRPGARGQECTSSLEEDMIKE